MNKLLLGTILTSLAIGAWTYPVMAASTSDINPDALLDMSLEQLANVEVTSVSKKAEKASEAAASIYVITQDDIRRSGMTSIPEVLRIVPGLDVAQSGSHQWSVSSRGFNDQYANKLLVLIDGRSVYTPLFSGVYWDVQDTPLQDIERIEVIRGPGATQWGANAVNGVINIITKSAKDTQGGMASLTAGSQDRSLNSVRYGTKIADNSYMRLYAKYDDRDEVRTATELGSHDEWNKVQSGFRADIAPGDRQSFTVQGDIYRGGENYTIRPASLLPTDTREQVRGGNMLGRWTNKISDTSELTVQAYYDDAQRDNLLFSSNIQTADLDVQHVYTAIHGHDIVWGGGYRMVKSSIEGTIYAAYTPNSRVDNLFSAFIQDKINLHADDIFLTLGSKFEHNDFTGFEYQPSARLSWLIDSKQTLWASVSRAVRTPNIGEADAHVLVSPPPGNTTPPFTFLTLTGDKNTKSEELVAYELGYRIQPAKNISVDISAFYNNYDRLIVGALGTGSGPFFNPFLGGNYGIQPVLPVNAGTAHSWGGEVSTKWNPVDHLELVAGYTLQQLKFDQPDPYGFSFAGKSPEQQFNIRSTVFLPHNVEWNTALYYVDDLAARDIYTQTTTPNYTRLDTRLAWQAMDGIELSLVGQNLLDPVHRETGGFLYQSATQIPRSYYGNIAVKF